MISTILRRGFFTLSMVLFLLLSFSLRPSFVKASQNSPPPAAKSPKSEKKDASSKDKSTGKLTRYFAQADGIHREAWWVITNEKWPVGKSPFGKVERALMASENIKLSNKSLFRCDRYLVKRGVLPAKGFPQKLEIFEKCSDKTEAKKIADVNFANEFDVQVTFFPENLAEILGLGPTILNKPIECRMQASDSGVLNSLNCKNWSQDRTKEQMVRLDSYNYQKDKKSLIKLRGKIYQNLTDIRKIEVDVPLEGKITVTETELYPPEEDDKKADAKKADKGKSAQKKSPTEKNMEPGSAESGETVKAPDTPAVDPDLIQGRFQTTPQEGSSQVAPMPSSPQGQALPPGAVKDVPVMDNLESPVDQGWPVDEQGNPLPASPQPQQSQQPQQAPMPTQPSEVQPVPVAPIVDPTTVPPPEGVPHGR